LVDDSKLEVGRLRRPTSYFYILFLFILLFIFAHNGCTHAYRRLRWLCALGFGGGWR
jgi:hypothetical protein